MRTHLCDGGPNEDPQRITVAVDVVPGPLTEAFAGRLVHLVVEELLQVGADVTAVRIEIQGDMATW
jgi:hypothetical protein